jgi:hypothetical protein
VTALPKTDYSGEIEFEFIAELWIIEKKKHL